MSGLWSTDRPEFAERVAKLAGGTTYRTPTGGRGTKEDHLPDAHAIAAALSFARQSPDDIGPDVAYCWVLQSDAYRQKVTRRLSIMLRSHKFRTMAQHRLAAAEAAWAVMIHGVRVKVDQPADLRPYDWDRLLLAAIAELHDSAWDALAEAERRYRSAA
jgi:hypothetical protein